MQRSRSIAWFLSAFVFIATPLVLAVITTEHLELHRRMHPFHSEFLDFFFRNVTHIGDGLVPTAVALTLLVLRDVRSFLMMGLSCGLSAIVVQALKRGPFASVDRPFMFKEELGDLHWVSDITMNHHFSFPSGHSTAVFSMCFALAVLIARPGWSVVLVLVAALVAYSRVYLSQHFLEDILAGATLGTMTGYAIYRWLYKGAFARKPWLDRRLLRS